jgi:ABC-type transporter MlaC component
MNAKRSFAIFSLVLAASAAAPAMQDSGAAQQRKEQAQQRLQQIQDRLKLTPEQIEQVRPVFADEMRQLKQVRDKYAGDQGRRSRLKMGREVRGIRNASDEKLKKILSKQQMDELKKLREEWREQMRERRSS